MTSTSRSRRWSMASEGRAESVTNTSTASHRARVRSAAVPHLLESAATITRLAAPTKAARVCDSTRFGVVSPASRDIPLTPRTSRSRWKSRHAATASGPTRAALGVGSPPVRTTAGPRGVMPSSSPAGMEFVNTLRVPAWGSEVSARATCMVVVPAVSPREAPGSTNAATASAMAILASLAREAFSAKAGSDALPSWAMAPP